MSNKHLVEAVKESSKNNFNKHLMCKSFKDYPRAIRVENTNLRKKQLEFKNKETKQS